MESVNYVKSAQLPAFTGQRQDFQTWWIRFQAFAGVWGFSSALIPGGDTDMPVSDAVVLDLSKTADLKAVKAKQRNALALSHLTMALGTQSSFGMVYKTQTTEWPGGLAHLVVKLMQKKYNPDDRIARVELRSLLSSVAMKANEDPGVLFEQVCTIQNRYAAATHQIDEEELLAVVMKAAAPAYVPIITMEQSIKGDKLTLDDLETVMHQQWRQTHGSSDSIDNDMALGAFDGFCYQCKQKGHKADKCPQRKQSNNDRRSMNNGGRGGRGRGDGGRGGGGRGRSRLYCRNCGKPGHAEQTCWLKEENKNLRPNNFRLPETGNAAMDQQGKVEYLLCGLTFPNDNKILLDPNIWIADTAATVHMTAHRNGLTDVRNATDGEKITMGNGNEETATEIGHLPGIVCDKYGNELNRVKIQNVSYLPNASFNLFSLTQMTSQGWTMGGNKDSIWITKGRNKVTFDMQIPTPRGVLYAMYFARDTEVAGAIQDNNTMTIQQAHERLGHAHEAEIRLTAKALNWTITRGTMPPCEACTAAKAKQKNVPKTSSKDPTSTTKETSRIYLDIATIRRVDKKAIYKNNWRIMVDERTQLKFSDFFDTKSGMIEPTCEQLHRWKTSGHGVKSIRMDNAKENLSLQKRSNSSDWKLGIDFELTARNTPQQNHLAELAFSHLTNLGRALMNHANVPLLWRYKLFAKAFKTVTILDGLRVIELDGVKATRYEHWCGANPDFTRHLRTWGEAGTVNLKSKATPKIADRGIQCMFVGYSTDHTSDCYEMWDPVTGGVHTTRDIIWLKRMFFTRPPVVPEIIPSGSGLTIDRPRSLEAGEGVVPDNDIGFHDTATGEDNAHGEDHANNHDDEGDKEDVPDEPPPLERKTRSGRTVRFPERLIAELNAAAKDHKLQLTSAEETYYSSMKELGEFGLIGAGIGGGFENTSELHVMKYNEAMTKDDKVNWDKAVEEEHTRMTDHEAWTVCDREDVPLGTKIITTTWAMKKKANGTYRARMNARGFEQVDGEHYDKTQISSPVVNEITVRMIFVLICMAQWYAVLLDVKGAFLCGNFENGENIYMEVPQGFERFYPKNTVLLLLKTIYGLKQAALAFWRELLKALLYMKYNRNKADPCLYFRWTVNGLVLWISWVDDCLTAGKDEAVIDAKSSMMKLFDCDDVGELKEYVGCKVDYDRDRGTMRLTQPVMIQSFVDEFELPSGVTHNTPAIPGTVLAAGEVEDQINAKQQSVYRSGVGKLLHMMRWTRPEIMNAVRELSRFGGRARQSHLAAMYRVMNYCKGTAERGLFLNPTARWDGDPNFLFEIEGISDSDWAKDPDSRRSVSGWSTFLHNAPISMKSKMMPVVALSVTEAELFAATCCAQDMLFEMRILESMGLKVKKPMILKIDNKGAKDLCDNWSVGGRTRHIEVKQLFLRELKEAKIIDSEWIPGDLNSSDMFTKNLSGPPFEKHGTKFVGVDKYMKNKIDE
jgi:hypothetical protein